MLFMRHIAIIGSGPAGCYLADHLLRLIPDASIDILERLPVPFGLIRYGVAPDHQGTKAVARVLDRVLSRDRVSFFGNVEVGRDVRLDELMSLYDAVVLATGAARDRRLGIPGEDLPGVIGSGAFTGWYNGHPDRPAAAGARVCARRSSSATAMSQLMWPAFSPKARPSWPVPISRREVTTWLEAQPIETIHIVGRRSAADAKFTEHELAELGTLQRARPVVVDPAGLAGDECSRRNACAASPQNDSRDAPVTIHFHFNLTPIAFLGDEQLRAVQFRSADGSIDRNCPRSSRSPASDTRASPAARASPANGVFPNDDGKVEDSLYVVGWAKRGPSGTIPTNRTEAQQVAQKIAQEVAGREPTGRSGAAPTARRKTVCWVDYAAWRRIDAAELARAGERALPEKVQHRDRDAGSGTGRSEPELPQRNDLTQRGILRISCKPTQYARLPTQNEAESRKHAAFGKLRCARTA